MNRLKIKYKQENILLELSKKLLNKTLRYITRTYLNRGPNQRSSSGAQDHDKNYLSFGFRFRNSVNECQVNSFLILAVLDWILKMKTKSHPKHYFLLLMTLYAHQIKSRILNSESKSHVINFFST